MNHLNCSTNQTNFKQIIKVLLKQGISVAKIAQHLGKHHSSIYREIITRISKIKKVLFALTPSFLNNL
jgi:IS30 family transposase